MSIDKAAEKAVRELVEDVKAGATGKFPQGKLTKSDEGELRIAVNIHNGKVVLAFGKAIEWIGLTPKLASELGVILIKHANTIEQIARMQGDEQNQKTAVVIPETEKKSEQ